MHPLYPSPTGLGSLQPGHHLSSVVQLMTDEASPPQGQPPGTAPLQQLVAQPTTPQASASARPAKGFRFASMFPPIPHKLVGKIHSLQYVDMRELLPDNVGLLRHMEAADNPSLLTGLPSYARPRMRAVSSISSWSICFAAYTAVLGTKHPDLVHSRLAYMAMLIAEERRYGGEGWRTYDSIFRQQAADDDSVDWTVLDHSLHASTFLHHGDGPGMFCSLCSGTDHTSSTCAMQAIMIQSTGQKPKPKTPNQRWQTNNYTTPPPVCLNWNRGICFRPDCRYRHTCATCPGSHPATHCPATPPGSTFKRPRGGAPVKDTGN